MSSPHVHANPRPPQATPQSRRRHRLLEARFARTSYGMTLQSKRQRGQTELVMTHKYFKAVLMLPLMAGALSGQGPSKQGLLMALKANGKQMISFQWKQKVTVYRKGHPSEPMIEEIRFDATGQPHRVTLAKPEEKRMGPLRARKAADIKEDVQEVMQLARRYSSPQQIAEAIQRGEVWEGQGKLRVQARAAVIPVDEMTILASGATYLPTRIDVKTLHEGSPVTIAIDYQQLPNGPSMMDRMTVQIPKDDIVVNVESFDFIRLAGPVTP
jgi:hypothetical protein